MRQFVGNLKFLVIFSILLLINDTSGLKCWRCSSDATNSKFCGETLDLSQISDHQKRWSYVECEASPPKIDGVVQKIENLIPKCRIILQRVNDVPTYHRSCYWEQDIAPPNSCGDQKYNPSFVKMVSCRTCVGDGCNDKLTIDNITIQQNTTDPKNSAALVALSHTVFAILMLSVVIGY